MKVLIINTVCGTGSTGRISVDIYNVLKQNGDECKIAYGRGEARGIPDCDAIKIGGTLGIYAHAFLGVHYPGDILFGTLVGVGAGILIYIIYRKLQNTVLKQANFISNQYTSSGYLISDIQLIKTVFYLTLFYVMVRGMMITLY